MTETAEIPVRADRAASQHEVKVFAICLGVLLVIFLLLQNPYWVPGGDSEVYTGAARSLALGKGYTFGGGPVVLVPPGWSILLAGATKISPTFLFLKLLTMSCMLGSLAIMFWIGRRFVPAPMAGLAIVLSGLISHVYSLTFWLHADAFFCLLSSAALLLAFQINEGRTQAWRVLLLPILLILATTVRWAGIFSFILVAAALMQGELWPKLNRRWILTAVCGLLTLATFVSLRAILRASVGSEPPAITMGESDEALPPAMPMVDNMLATQYHLFNPSNQSFGYLLRAAGWGNWFSYLMWQPFRIRGPVVLPGLVLGWTILIALIALGWRSIGARQWIWAGLLLYSFILAMNWTHPNARYLVPVTPLILVGLFLGMRMLFRENWLLPAAVIFALALVVGLNAVGTLAVVIMRPLIIIGVVIGLFMLANRLRTGMTSDRLDRLCHGLLVAFVASLILCNGALWAVDVYVARSKDFYARYEAGLNRDLIAAAKWLNAKDIGPAGIGVTTRYVNMGRTKVDSQLGLRIVAMLTDGPVVRVRDVFVKPRPPVEGQPGSGYSGDPRRNPTFLAWARSIGLKYVVYQPEVSPWRIFHFRMGWLQKMMNAGEEPRDTGAGWRLYEIPAAGDEAVRISLDPVEGWPTRVPGI